MSGSINTYGFPAAVTTLAYETCSRFSQVFGRLEKTNPTKVHRKNVC